MEEKYDEEQRWKIFLSTKGRCVSSGVKLTWEDYNVRGRSGGWVIDEGDEDEPQPAAPMSFKCLDHPIARKRRQFIIDEGV